MSRTMLFFLLVMFGGLTPAKGGDGPALDVSLDVALGREGRAELATELKERRVDGRKYA